MSTALFAVSMSCLRHSLPCSVHRLSHVIFKTGKGRLSGGTKHSTLKKFNRKLEFEKGTGVKDDILLYSNYGKESMNQFYSFGALFLGLCCLNGAHFIYTMMKDLKPPPPKPRDSFSVLHWCQTMLAKYNLIPTSLAVIISVIGFVIGWTVHINLSHQVRSIKLLRGGDKILLEHYGFFGRVLERELKLEEVSAQPIKSHLRAQDSVNIRVKQERFNYYIELSGEFQDRKLFNSTVGMSRSYTKK